MRISDWSSDVCSSDLAAATIFGRTEDGMAGVSAFLSNVPPGVANALRGPIEGVLTARTGNLLWFGAVVGLWTTGSLIETIRDILRRAYGRSEEHTSELQSLMRNSYAVFCLKKKK